MRNLIIRDGKPYVFKHLPGFTRMKRILKMVFKNNNNSKDFEYLGCLNSDGEAGVCVSGMDICGVRKINLFYTVEEIEDFIR